MENKTALLVIDIQEAMTGKDASIDFGYERCAGLITNANRLVEHAQKNGWEIAYVAEAVPWYNLVPAAVTGFRFMKGSKGAAFDRRLNIVNDNVFDKMFASAFSNRRLKKFLEERDVERLVICGLAADACVTATSKGGLARGFRVTVASDACTSKTDEMAQDAFRKIQDEGVRLESTADIVSG
jgi:nicotinamidase-related amidase